MEVLGIYLLVHFVLLILFHIMVHEKGDVMSITEFIINLFVGPYLLMWFLYLIVTNNEDYYDKD